MDAHRRTLPLRRVATVAALAALAAFPLPAGQAEAKTRPELPVITSVSPMRADVGDTLTIRGSGFRKGKGRNSVGFKRDGAAVVFVKADISTTRLLKVKVPARLEGSMSRVGTTTLPTVFRLRILTTRFGAAFTSAKRSPTIGPKAPTTSGTAQPTTSTVDPLAPVSAPAAPAPAPAEADCDSDGIRNGADADDDNDLLPDALENTIGTNGCKADSDGDGVEDGYEYRSAVDLNDDEYQSPNTVLPYPGKRGYPNPLDPDDAGTDHDGDGLSLRAEYTLWKYTTPSPGPGAFDPVPGQAAAGPLSYSDGLKYSVSEYCGHLTNGDPSYCGPGDANRRVPALSAGGYGKWANLVQWASDNSYTQVKLRPNPQLAHPNEWWFAHANDRVAYDFRDVDLSGGAPSATELFTLDRDHDGWLSDNERDEDADGLSNLDEIRSRMQPGYWSQCYTAEPAFPTTYAGTSAVDADSDGDGVRDGLDDQDHDDFPNIMELSRFAASHADDTDDRIKDSVTGGGADCKADPDLKPDDPRHPDAYGQVNPFNPCLPDPRSRSCPVAFDFGTLPAPFSGPDWWALN